MNTPLHPTAETFDREVLAADRPVLVDFWAPWCGPCKALAPVIDEITHERPGALVAKVNVDDAPALAARFGIRSIPTLLYFQGGVLRDTTIGLLNKTAILAHLDALARPTTA